jgi:glycosyltransferase involved in cell wall biosynthesis
MHNSHLIEQPAEWIVESRIDHFVFVSSYLQTEAIGCFPFLNNTSVLHNGADEHMFYPASPARPPRDVPQILFASRLVKEKGVHVFLDAMRLLEQWGIAAKGIIVGASHFGGSRKTAYMAEIEKRVPTNVELRPYCSGEILAALFRESDIFCSPSIWDEPFGMVNVEAFASRTPVVSTHGGGSKEVFIDGGGLLVERGSAEKLARALVELIESPDLREEIATAGYRSFKKRYTWAVVQQGYRKILDAVAR